MATTASDLAAGQIAMVDAARYTQEHVAVCTNIFKKLILGAGEKSKFIPKFGTATASDLTDGIDMANENLLTITGTTHTTDEAGCKVIITKKLRAQLKEDAYAAAGKVIGNAMGKKIDQDGLSLFSGLDSGFTIAASTLNLGYLAAGVAQCMGQVEPVPGPFVLVCHPYQVNAFVDQLTVSGTTVGAQFPDGISEPLLREYWRGREKLYGVNIFVDGNIEAAAGTATSAFAALFSPSAFIYLVGWEPENWVEEDKSLRGWEIGIVADYGMVEEDGTYGRFFNALNSAPTA